MSVKGWAIVVSLLFCAVVAMPEGSKWRQDISLMCATTAGMVFVIFRSDE